MWGDMSYTENRVPHIRFVFGSNQHAADGILLLPALRIIRLIDKITILLEKMKMTIEISMDLSKSIRYYWS